MTMSKSTKPVPGLSRVDVFSKRMKERLVANANKGDWAVLGTRFSLQKAREKIVDLEHLMTVYETKSFRSEKMRSEEVEKILNEAANLANYAFILADNLLKEEK